MLRWVSPVAFAANLVTMVLTVLAGAWMSFAIAWAGACFAGYAMLFYREEKHRMERGATSYRNLAMRIRYDITHQRLPAGTRLPSREDYVKTYGTTRATLSKAMKMLAEEGLIELIQGRGTYVVGPGGDRGLRADRPKDAIEAHLRQAARQAAPGTPMPTTRTLMIQHQVSQSTVRRVQHRLSREGVIYRHASGYYVKS